MIKYGRNLKIRMLELSHEEFTIGALREASIWEHVAQCSSYTEKSISVTQWLSQFSVYLEYGRNKEYSTLRNFYGIS